MMKNLLWRQLFCSFPLLNSLTTSIESTSQSESAECKRNAAAQSNLDCTSNFSNKAQVAIRFRTKTVSWPISLSNIEKQNHYNSINFISLPEFNHQIIRRRNWTTKEGLIADSARTWGGNSSTKPTPRRRNPEMVRKGESEREESLYIKTETTQYPIQALEDPLFDNKLATSTNKPATNSLRRHTTYPKQ